MYELRKGDPPTCCFCPKGKNEHLIVRCEVFLKTPVKKRMQIICADKRCVRCFRPGHVARDCPSKAKCRKCKGEHNTHLHKVFEKNDRSKFVNNIPSDDEYHDGLEDGEEPNDPEEEDQLNTYRASEVRGPAVQVNHAILPVIPVRLRNGKKSVRVNALLDSGATSNLMSHQLRKELGLDGPSFKTRVALACGVVKEIEKTKVSCNIVIPQRGERVLHACAVEDALGDLEAIDWNRVKDSYSHLRSVHFPEHVPGQVQLLLGVNEWDLILPQEIPISGKEGDPVAIYTQLGWTACGYLDDGVREQHQIKRFSELYARASFNRAKASELEIKEASVERITSLHAYERCLRDGFGLDKNEYRDLYQQRKLPCPLDDLLRRERKSKAVTHDLPPLMYQKLENKLKRTHTSEAEEGDLAQVVIESGGFPPPSDSQARSMDIDQCQFSKAFEDELAKKILSEWEPEVRPEDESPSLSAEQVRCWKLLQEERVFQDGYYIMPVLWKVGEPTLEPDYTHALQRLNHLMRHLQRHGMTEKYDEQIRGHINSGYLEPVENYSGKFYLPHFAVIREDKTTTKLRQVFDGAASRKGGRSLNSAISAGPKLITDLVQVLMYYRAHRVALAGDIREMFLQVRLFPKDRVYHHILHRKDESSPVEELQWTRHPFGSAGSPAVAIATLKLHAKDHRHEYPVAARDVLQHSLVDDILSSFPTEEEAVLARQEWSEMCSKAGMQVRKFITNSPEVFEQIPPELREKKADLSIDVQDLDGEHMLKTLGMKYNVKADEFSYSLDLSDSPSVEDWTKRTILTCYARFYDPLGLLAPFTLIPRRIFQGLWREERGWDDKLGKITEWQEWLESAENDVHKIRIPRCVTRLLRDGSAKIQDQTLHAFADASSQALGVAIYLVTVYEDGKVVTNNVRSRSKLAQLKPTTVPRLELAAAVMAVETAQNVISTYGVDKITYYTDSTTTLLWLRTLHRQLKQFVANRVMKILSRSKLEDWLYVNTSENPADIPSRGALAAELLESSLWWQGPEFLRELRQPDQPDLKVKPEQREEFNKETKDLFEETPAEVAYRFQDSGVEFEPLHCDDQKLDYLKEALDAVRDKLVGDKLTQKEADEQLLLRLIAGAQQSAWPELSEGFCKPSHPLARLSPRKDHQGLFRATTRISLSKDVDVSSTPILLPHNEHITWLIVKDFHESNLRHAGGPAYLLSRIRKDYWIHRGTRLVQNVLKKCLECKFKRAKPSHAPEAPLPYFRLPTKEPITAFTDVGVDCAGPWEVNVGRRTEKRWIILFICTTTKAIFVEVIESLSTEAVLMALDLLSARRGMPTTVRSDNGTNFRGASKELNNLLLNDQDKLEQNSHKITWVFNTPLSPHQGGLWERTIGTLKRAMEKTMTCDQYLSHKLRAEEFRVLVTVAEGFVNHRPLTAVSMEAGDLAPITPADFCLCNPSVGFHPPAQGGISRYTSHQKRWALLQEYQDMLWKRLRREVVPKYAEFRRSWLRNKTNLRRGDIVIVMEPNSKGVHRIGRVLEVFPGIDGIARNANVKVLKSVEEIEEEMASKRTKMTAEVLVGHKIYQRSLASLAVLASTEEIERVRKADLPPVPSMEESISADSSEKAAFAAELGLVSSDL